MNTHCTTSIAHHHSAIVKNPTPWLFNKPGILTLYASNPIPRRQTNVLTLLTRCSTKPDINTNSEIGQNSASADEPGSTPNPEHLPTAKLGDDDSLSSSSSLSLPCSSRGLVFDLGPSGSWDSRDIGSPVVKRFLSDDEERWYMWYHGSSGQNPGSDSLGLAVSSNGIHWERGFGPVRSAADVGLVMNVGQDWWSFDTLSIRPGEVVVMSSSKVKASSAVYWLYYTGLNSEKVDLGADDGDKGEVFSRSLPGLAISQDGRYWARIEGDHHSGALFDVGSDGEWDSLFIAGPQVVFHGSGDLRMYYHSFDVKSKQFCIGMARSRDGIKWVKLGKVLGGGKVGGFDELGAVNASVIKNKKDGNYVMAYEGVDGDGKRSIGIAVSSDGLREWRRVDEGDAVLRRGEEEDGWDNQGVGYPCLVQMEGGDVDGEWRLYYRGVGNGGRSGIGMAVSRGSDISNFRKWTGFQS
ncbi:unnamed protein product [Linum trigynum]